MEETSALNRATHSYGCDNRFQ